MNLRDTTETDQRTRRKHHPRQRLGYRVKVCGLTDAEQALAAARAGASFGGLIFAPGSARQVPYDRARSICASAPLSFVGVFVDDSIDHIVCCAERLDLAAVQLHGRESNERCLELRRRLPAHTELWKACHVGDELPRLSSIHADRVLLDNYERGQHANSSVFDWSILAELDADQRQRVILGGGLTPDNAAQAARFGTWALDVNLGVETSAGVKSPRLLERFFCALREV
jgi:indole-3-glycerol phosphate synthase / phosphoribosylanthranilate isomerase